MPDDPNKRGAQDRSRTSKQKHEQVYRRRRAKVSRSSARTRRKPARSTGTRSGDATALLREDHVLVDKMFKQYEKAKDTGRKAALVQKICGALKAHTTVEEEIFYPAVREAIDDDALMDEADVEHATAKELIAQLEAGHPGDDHYDAKVIVLGEYIRHHVKEEQGEIFPKARKAKIDLKDLGFRIQARKAELMPEETGGRSKKGLLQRLSIDG
jgi:hemerythrin-like domain-containing protein